MAKGKSSTASVNHATDDDTKKSRTLSDYSFEEHQEDGTVTSLGLVLHYPSEATIVQKWLEGKKEELGINGQIRICQKKYHTM